MKTSKNKTVFAFVSAALLCAATLLGWQPRSSALAFEKVQGQDKTGKNCERIDTPGSSTFGKCENVCQGKEITRDAPNNRWVCKASKPVVKPVTKAPGASNTPGITKAGKATKQR